MTSAYVDTINCSDSEQNSFNLYKTNKCKLNQPFCRHENDLS